LLNEVRDEVVSLLSQLIQINTTNPPGNEVEAARFLREWLERDGLECEVIESSAGRGNLITRTRGTGDGPSLLLLSHLDVAPARPEEGTVDPFSGLIKDGFVWGRGAIDCKGLVAVEAMVMRLLARENIKPKGDIIFAATADEERGGEAGVGWLVKNHPEKILADYVINEGGGFAIPTSRGSLFAVQTAEKGVIWMRVRAGGRPGHGSVPGVADNAILRMAEVVQRLGRHRSEIVLVPTVRRYLEGLSSADGPMAKLLARLLSTPSMADEILDRMAERDRELAELLRAMLRATIAPTIVRGGMKENIIPSTCEAVFDCRILPGQTKEGLLREVQTVLKGIEKLEFEWIHVSEPTESPTDTPLFQCIQEVLREFIPDSSVVPFMMTGGTDSRFLRLKGCVCYGFQPMKADVPFSEVLKMIHGVDERISIENLVFGVSLLYRLVRRFLG